MFVGKGLQRETERDLCSGVKAQRHLRRVEDGCERLQYRNQERR
jgi:hypothetical protein